MAELYEKVECLGGRKHSKRQTLHLEGRKGCSLLFRKRSSSTPLSQEPHCLLASLGCAGDLTSFLSISCKTHIKDLGWGHGIRSVRPWAQKKRR